MKWLVHCKHVCTLWLGLELGLPEHFCGGLGLRPDVAFPPLALQRIEVVWDGVQRQARVCAWTQCSDWLFSHFLSLGLT